MDLICNAPLCTILLSLLSSVLCTLLRPRAAMRYTIVLETLLLGLCIGVLGYTVRTDSSFTYVMGEFPAPWGNEIRAGVLEALMAVAFLIVLLCSVLAGWEFILIDVEESKRNLYFSIIHLVTAALMALIWTNDLFTGYVFLEIMTLGSCGLMIIREIGRTTLAAVRYMILNLLGSGLFLLGVVLLYNLTGHLLMVPMQSVTPEILENGGTMPLSFSLGILIMGLGIKSGMFPFYFWMPDTYGTATPTSAAILSSLVSKGYIFLLFKICMRAIGAEVLAALPLQPLLLLLGVGGMVAGSISAIRSQSINRMVAYSSAAQIGYIYMGFGLGSEAGYTAALFQILVHAVTKSLLFLTTPRLARVSGDSLLFENLRGSARRAMEAGLVFTVCALSMVGIPCFAGFSAKLFFAIAAVQSGSVSRIALVMGALAISSVLNVFYFIRTVIRIYARGTGGRDISAPALYAQEMHAPPEALEEPDLSDSVRYLLYILPALVLTLCNLFLGLFSNVSVQLIVQGLGMFG